MEIKASDVKKLREMTGAGMMECKKALVDAEGDFKKAEKKLKELGLAAAAKRDGRATNEGRVFIKNTGKKSIMIEIACETDFVAKNKDFVALGNKLVETIDSKGFTSVNEELEGIVKETVAIIKENISLKRMNVINAADDEILVDYNHGEGRVGVIVQLKTGKPELVSNDKIKELGFDLALHIAAFNPAYISEEYVDADYLKEQEEIFTVQAQNLGKPANVLAGIVKGKVSKHLAEICLVDQGFVKDEKKKVSEVLKEIGKDTGGTLSIKNYVYFKVGA